MYFWLAIISIILLIFLYPIRFNMYTEDGLKSSIILFGLFTIKIDVKRVSKKFYTRKQDETKDLNIMETLENYKKVLSAEGFIKDMLRKSTIEEFNWYSAIPMDNPILGLSLLPIYTTAQTFAVDFIFDNFGKIKDYDVDTKYNYLTDEIFIYFNSIIRINLLKIMIVSVKYITKIPLLIKRIT